MGLKKTTIAGYGAAIAVSLSLLCTSCKIFIPAHRNSNWRNGEQVQIELIDLEAARADTNFSTNYKAVFGFIPGEEKETKFAIAAAPVVAAAVNFTLDYVAKALQDEAKLYTAQFGDTIADSGFWLLQAGNQKPNYYGVHITRDIVDSKGRRTNAYKLVCGMCPTPDNRLITMKPLIFSTHKAKAKVVGDGPASVLAVYPWIFNHPNNQINSTVDFKIDGYFKDKDQFMKVIPMGAFSFKFPAYDLSLAKELTAAATDVNRRIPPQSSGFLDTAPFSIDTNGKSVVEDTNLVVTGSFTMKVTVTEADTSNAQQNIEKLGELVSQQKQAIIGQITNQVTNP
jgi:hypothetical protein